MEEKYNKSFSGRIDLLNTIIIIMFFLLIIIFSYGEFNKNLTNIFMIFGVMIGTIIGYYTNITLAMVYAITFDFLYASINVYLNILKPAPIEFEVYFWMVVIPVFTIIFAFNGKQIKELQKENSDLKMENAELVMIDKETQLRSSQTFFDELQSYMNISKRYGVPVYLILIKLKYENEIANIIGEKKYRKVINQISHIIDLVLREEDRKYILRNMNMFGIICLSNKEGGKFVKRRLKEIIQSAEFSKDYVIKKVKLEVIIGMAEYDQSTISDPYDFLKAAEKDMEYDV